MMKCSRVGYVASEDMWVYPKYPQIKEQVKDVQWFAVKVDNNSTFFQTQELDVCAVVVFINIRGDVNINGRLFRPVWQSANKPVTTLFIPQ